MVEGGSLNFSRQAPLASLLLVSACPDVLGKPCKKTQNKFQATGPANQGEMIRPVRLNHVTPD